MLKKLNKWKSVKTYIKQTDYFITAIWNINIRRHLQETTGDSSHLGQMMTFLRHVQNICSEMNISYMKAGKCIL